MKNYSINASFSQREMNAIVKMLLSKDGIDVDPIINDLYPGLDEEFKSVFRCKLALLIGNKVEEFVPYTGFRRISSRQAYLYQVVSESILLETKELKKLQKYELQKDEICTENINWQSYETLDEAIKHW